MSTSTPVQIPRLVFRRRILSGMARGLFRLLTRYEIIGKENIPQSGPYIVVANHFNFADPAVIATNFPPHIEFIAGTNRPNAPKITTWIPGAWVSLNVRRGTGAAEAMKAATSVLQQGGVLGVFPEAGAWADVLRPARPGTALIAAKTGVPVIPVGIDGATDIFPSIAKFKRANLTVNIGKPFGPFNVIKGNRVERRQHLDAIGEEIMRQISTLIPPERRGIFSDDPQLRAEAEKVAPFPWD